MRLKTFHSAVSLRGISYILGTSVEVCFGKPGNIKPRSYTNHRLRDYIRALPAMRLLCSLLALMATCRFCGVHNVHEAPLEVIFYCTASLQPQRPSSLVDLRCLSPPDPVFLTSCVHVVSQFPHSLPYAILCVSTTASSSTEKPHQLGLPRRGLGAAPWPRLPFQMDIPITMQEKKEKKFPIVSPLSRRMRTS